MNLNRRICLKLAVLWLAGSLNCQTALALSSDSEQPIHITADQAVLYDRKQVAIYRGNVHFTQGTLRIDSDVLILHYTSESGLKKAIAKGQPAWYHQRPDNSKEAIRAKALRMEYHADTETVYLFRKVHVWQGDNEFTGDIIKYDIRHNIVRGKGTETGTGRVHVIIRPGVEDAKEAAPSLPPAEQTTGKGQAHHAQAHGRTMTWINLRAGPGTDYNKIALIPPRTRVSILEWQNDWLRITLFIKDERKKGWVHGKYIRLQKKQKN